MKLLEVTSAVRRARGKWQYTGKLRPPFADTPAPGQRSVWDFPRPPRIELINAELSVAHQGSLVAVSKRCRQVLETAGAPTYYFPPDDVREDVIRISERTFDCEWKGLSRAIDLNGITDAGWWLDLVYPEFVSLRGWYAFYPQRVDCFVDAEKARPQPGGYYGGWVTSDIAGPIKGGPGSAAW